jgi:hypothetical protein
LSIDALRLLRGMVHLVWRKWQCHAWLSADWELETHKDGIRRSRESYGCGTVREAAPNVATGGT